MSQCNGKWPISLVYAWKPLITATTAIGNWSFDRHPIRQRATNRNVSCPHLLGWLVYIIKEQHCLFNCSVIHPASHEVNVHTSQSLEQPFVFRKCEKKSTSNIKSNMFLTYHAVNQVDRSQGFKGSMILWRQKKWCGRRMRSWSSRHQEVSPPMLFLLV